MHYASPNTDALGVVAERAAGAPLAELIFRHVWEPMGAERDARLTLDPSGTAGVSGYGNQWWRRDGRTLARGIHGQSLTVDRAAGVVVTVLSSWPDAKDPRSVGGAASSRGSRVRAPRGRRVNVER